MEHNVGCDKRRSRRSGEKIDLKSGEVFIVRSENDNSLKFRIFMKIVGNYYEHHAHLYTDADYCYQYGIISLRNCHLSSDSSDGKMFSVHVVRNGTQSATGIQFEAKSKTEAEEWIDAMTSKYLAVPNELVSPNASPVFLKQLMNRSPTEMRESDSSRRLSISDCAFISQKVGSKEGNSNVVNSHREFS